MIYFAFYREHLISAGHGMAETKGNETKGERASTNLYEMVINGTPFHLRDEVVAYEQLGDLAHPGHSPEAMFTVTYRNANAPHGGSGTFVVGESVRVRKEGASFNVRLTTRS